MANSLGKTGKQVRKFLRENGVPPTASNVEIVGREIRRTESENERLVKFHKEMERERGVPSTTDSKGDVIARVRRQVQADLERRHGRR